MIKLYGMRMSNYYSLTKALLIEKGIDFEEVVAPPARDEEYLSRSPMGKMPSIEVDGHFMSESLAIFQYLERLKPEPALLPSDAFAAGKAIELACHIKLDIELVARRCLPELIFGKPVSEETKAQVRKDLAKGVKAVSRIAVCDPYIAGKDFSIADLYVYYCYALANQVASKIVEVDILSETPSIADLIERLSQRPSIARVTAEAAG
jgi:glutathione S-transferase